MQFADALPRRSGANAVARALPFARMSSIRGTQLDRIRLPVGTSVSEAIASLSAQPGVAVAQPDYLYRPTAVPTDADFGQEWGLLNTGQSHDTSEFDTTSGLAGADAKVTTAWDTTMGDPSVRDRRDRYRRRRHAPGPDAEHVAQRRRDAGGPHR